MIDAVEQHIVSRLRHIKFGGTSVIVYPYEPGREQGETRYPCFGVVLRDVLQSFRNSRPCCDLIKGKGEDITIEVRVPLGGGTATGPPEHEVEPYPTVVDLIFQVGVYATRAGDLRALVEALYQAFPPGYTAVIGENKPTFILHDVADNDDFEKPLFSKLFSLRVLDLQLERWEKFTTSSVKDVLFTIDNEN